MAKLPILLGAICTLASTVCSAQYADEETCALLADLEDPGFHEIDSLEESTSVFFARFREANPDLPKEFSEPQDGWLFFIFADCYRQGIVVEKNREWSDQLLEMSASQGNRQAAHMVASLAVFQSDDPAKQKTGFEYLEREYTEDGSAYAAGKLGWAYQQGFGVDRNLKKAVELYEFAASRGMTYWQYLLAHAYERGYLGFDIDKERSAYWLEFKPKTHIALYECWVADYYRDGIFPANDELQSRYRQACDETDLGEWWANFESE